MSARWCTSSTILVAESNIDDKRSGEYVGLLIGCEDLLLRGGLAIGHHHSSGS
jgi:hypothetical protein